MNTPQRSTRVSLAVAVLLPFLSIIGCGAGLLPTAATTGTLSPYVVGSSNVQVLTQDPSTSQDNSFVVTGKIGQADTLQMGVIGAAGTATWSNSGDTLPSGVQFLASGLLNGSFSTPYAGSVEFTATDSAARTTSVPVVFSFGSSAIPSTAPNSGTSVQTIALDPAFTGSAYNATLWSPMPANRITYYAGSLPSGMELTTGGQLKGTPAAAGSYSFVAASVSAKPLQITLNYFTLSVTTVTPLQISTASLQSATVGSSYSAALQATGGTPGYTWRVASGSLPGGLTLAASTGIISGTPTAPVNSAVTFAVQDASAATAQAALAVDVNAGSEGSGGSGNNAPVGTTWFVRPDGGTRYDASLNTVGQCDGLADTAYPGSGVNQHCAFNDVRYMWMLPVYGNSQWVMAGGDTLVIRGCAAMASQQNADAPHCRIGWDKPTGNDAENFWCAGVSAWWGCSMPPPPSGTATQHTRILGGCAWGTYSCNPVVGYPYTNNNLTQLFAGYSSTVAMYLSGSQYVDVEGLEITTHNGQCARYGTTNPLPGCNRGATYPLSDQADQGIVTNNASANILLQDVYIHGFSSSGMTGPIGGAFMLTRVSLDFNTFAGWNFDDGSSTPNAVGSTITQSFVTMIGNGCQEEYPIVHTQFPARGCWDSSTGGFGDAWSGQNSTLASFTCDHCNISYNTKDGALGPHTVVHSISITNSIWAGNMGQSGKWGQDANATFLFRDNLLMGNCMRMSQLLPGAGQNFDSSVNIAGSGLAGYCRAAGSLFDYFADAGASVNFINNTVVSYQPTIFELGCRTQGACGATPYTFTNNVLLGYTSAYTVAPFNPGAAPGLYYKDEASVAIAGSHNLEYGIRDGDLCGTNSVLCVDPVLIGEPAQGTHSLDAALDNFNYHPSSASEAVRTGATTSLAPTLDYYGTTQTSPVTLGAVVAE